MRTGSQAGRAFLILLLCLGPGLLGAQTGAAGSAAGAPGLEAGGAPGDRAEAAPEDGVVNDAATEAAPEGEAGGAGDAAPEDAAEDAVPEDSAEDAAEDAAEGEGEDEGLTEEKVIELDIKTSTLPELAAWCRSLGLSEGGSRDELAARLRNYYRLTDPASSSPDSGGEGSGGSRQRIVIESARSTEYFTLSVVDEEYARLQGNVIISLANENATHRISAQEILYNRSRNQVTARGGVTYIKEEGDTIETFRGESITVNLDSWATFLTEGISERAISGEATTYRFEGSVISRSEEEVTILKNAQITNVSGATSYWSLNATKLWLLPGSDFALQNAVLKVGEIPVLYMPFFYLPADEVIFHPVLGYRSREGNFIQTTTYILGRPKPEDLKESSLTKIMGSGAEMEKERQGIFLRSTGKKAVNPSETSLKALFDLYANLGAYFGLDMRSPGIGILRNFEFSTGLGRTRDIVPPAEDAPTPTFNPFPRNDGTYDWNRSQILSWNVPLRYRFKTMGSLSGTAGNFSWEIPYYSDPYVDQDFLNRAESMDWFNIIQQGAALDQEITDTMLSSYEWRLNGSLGTGAPKILAPYLTTLSLSNFSSTLMFNYRDSDKYRVMGNTYSPSRQFYFPDKLTIYSLSLNLGGTPLTLGNSVQSGTDQQEAQEDPLWNIGTLRPPWEVRESESQSRAQDIWNLSPPVLNRRYDISRGGGPQFSIGYQINPAAVSELQFRTGTDPLTGRYHWAEAEDVDWEDVSSILSTVKGDANTSFSLSHPQGAYSNVFRFSGSGAYQNYWYTDREAEEFAGATEAVAVQRVGDALSRIYNATFFTTSYDYTGTVKPLYQNQIWRDSSLSYSFRGILAKSVFDSESVPNTPQTTRQEVWDATPRWDIEQGAWDKDYLETHQFSTVFNANIMDKVQNLTFTLVMPPLDSSLAGNFTTRIWFSEFNLNMRVQEPWEEEKRKLEPLYVTGTFHFGRNLGSLQQYMAYDSEKKEYQTLTTKLSFWGFSSSFTAIHGIPYEFSYNPVSVAGNGWVQGSEPELHPQELRFGFTKSLPAKQFWKDRFSLALNTNSNLFIDLQRYTYSRFDTTLGLTLGIKNFLDLTLSATSENAVIYRYLRDLPGFELPVATSGESNVFTDLLNSFRFDDEQLRTDSGFKLKSFNLQATHSMGDWNATLGVTLAPYLKQPDTPGDIPTYQFNTQISFVVQWLPISEIKSELKIDKDQWITK
jgi:hypothetical protein